MKVKHFLKRRIFPVMLSLVIVFFSVVIPCARVEASSLVVPAPAAGFSYYDLVSSAFLSTGFDCPLQKSDGTRTTFGKEMYDELCDTFDLWCNDNFGTTDANEIKDQLRALPGNIANGAVTIGKKLWEGLKGFASDAYDKSIDFLSSFSDASAKDASYVNNFGDLTWSFVKSVTGCIPSQYSNYLSVSAINKSNLYAIGKGITKNGDFCYFLFSGYRVSEPLKVSSTTSYDSSSDSYYERVSITFNGSYDNSYIWDLSGNLLDSPTISSAHILSTNCSSMRTCHYAYGGTVVKDSTDSVAGMANSVIWPKQTLAVDKVVTAPTSWTDAIAKDIIVPGEAADTAVIGLTHTDEVSDVIPGTATGDVTEDPAIPDESVDAGELVGADEIATLPEKALSAGDVTKLFPFCIPFDIVALIKNMQAEKRAPVWKFEYYFKTIDYTFKVEVDMSEYEKYVKVFRSGFIIFYIITLMMITIRFSNGIAKD